MIRFEWVVTGSQCRIKHWTHSTLNAYIWTYCKRFSMLVSIFCLTNNFDKIMIWFFYLIQNKVFLDPWQKKCPWTKKTAWTRTNEQNNFHLWITLNKYSLCWNWCYYTHICIVSICNIWSFCFHLFQFIFIRIKLFPHWKSFIDSQAYMKAVKIV